MPHVVQVHDQAEHEHGAENGPNGGRPRRRRKSRARDAQRGAHQHNQNDADPERNGKMTEANEDEAQADQPGGRARAKQIAKRGDRQREEEPQSIAERQKIMYDESAEADDRQLQESAVLQSELTDEQRDEEKRRCQRHQLTDADRFRHRALGFLL